MDNSACVPVAMPGNRLRILIYIIIAVSSVLTAVTVFLLVERINDNIKSKDALADLAANLQELNTTVLAIQSKVEQNKVSADADSLVHHGKITQLENDSSLHALLIQDHAHNDQNLGTRISSLETETTANQATIHELNNTLGHLISNVSSNEDAVNDHQMRLEELDTDIGETVVYVESVKNSLTKLEANTLEQIISIKDIKSTMKQLEAGIASNNDIIQQCDARISEVEINVTTKHASEIAAIKAIQQNRSSIITQLESNTIANAAYNHVLGTRISSLETDNTANQATILELNNTLDHLISNVSSNEDAINDHRIRLRELAADIEQSIRNEELVNSKIAKLETNASEQILAIKDIESTIKQLETDGVTQNEIIQQHDARISKLEINITTSQASEITAIQAIQHDHNSMIAQLESDTVENADYIQEVSTRISSLETGSIANQANIIKLNNTLDHFLINISSNEAGIKNHQMRLSELEADIEQSIVNEALANSKIAKLATNASEQILAIKDIESTIKQLETDGVIKDEIIQQHDTRMSKLELNVTINHASEIAAIEVNQRRIAELESDNRAASNIYENMDFRLNYLDDGLNCTWTTWSSFSPCTVTCGVGIQYRGRSCDGFNSDVNEHWCSRIETDIQTCSIEPCQPSPFDCKYILEHGFGTTDGVYFVTLNETGEVIRVYCDMTSDGGGWTVRIIALFEGYCTGLRYIYLMTKGVGNELRLDLEKSTSEKGYAVYKSFSLSERPKYILNIGTYSGTAGDDGYGLSFNNGSSFTPRDRDVDARPNDNCGVLDHAGWWYNSCTHVNLNGDYVEPGTQSSYRFGEGGVIYRAFDGVKSLKSTEMKFRRTN